MKHLVLSTLFILFGLFSGAMIGTEIYLFDIEINSDGISLSKPENITNRKGYDNQPSFHPTEPLIFYSSFDEEERSDIKVYNQETKQTLTITHTNEREYSPTLTPESSFLSCIIQRDNGQQDLGKYPIEGGQAQTLINELIVGYHCWINTDELILFVLGEPHELHHYSLNNKKSKIVAKDIGRSLHKIPHSELMSFVHKTSKNEWWVNSFNPKTGEIAPIIECLPGREDLCWTLNGTLLTSDENALYFYNIHKDTSWHKVETDRPYSFMKGITRLAISPDNKQLAVVVSELEK